jgi:hypothetical protein
MALTCDEKRGAKAVKNKLGLNVNIIRLRLATGTSTVNPMLRGS